MKRVLSFILVLVMFIAAILTFTGCTSEATRVNYNISKQAQYFETERRVTVYNARTDKVIMYVEGYIDISNNTTDELVVTAKVAPSVYKKNYVYLTEYTLYIVEDISGTHSDPYHYKVYFNTHIFPDIEVK